MTTSPQPRSYTSLLDYIVADSVDSDYARVAASRIAVDQPTVRTVRATANRPRVVAVLAMFGLLIGVSALLTSKQAPAVDQQRIELARTVARQENLYDEEKRLLARLRTNVASLRVSTAKTTRSGDQAKQGGAELEVAAGSTAVKGPGVRIMVADAPGAQSPSSQGTIRDRDLQALVNGLWQAGAEAITINGMRIGPSSAIRFAGEAITLNYRSLLSPYNVVATGDPNTLPARFAETQGGQLIASLHTTFNVKYSIETARSLLLPANTREHVRYAGTALAQPDEGGD